MQQDPSLGQPKKKVGFNHAFEKFKPMNIGLGKKVLFETKLTYFFSSQGF